MASQPRRQEDIRQLPLWTPQIAYISNSIFLGHFCKFCHCTQLSLCTVTSNDNSNGTGSRFMRKHSVVTAGLSAHVIIIATLSFHVGHATLTFRQRESLFQRTSNSRATLSCWNSSYYEYKLKHEQMLDNIEFWGVFLCILLTRDSLSKFSIEWGYCFVNAFIWSSIYIYIYIWMARFQGFHKGKIFYL
jgi:hypothetical protein